MRSGGDEQMALQTFRPPLAVRQKPAGAEVSVGLRILKMQPVRSDGP